MFSIDNQITQFEPISLDRMDEVKLLNRMDTKFAFSLAHLPGILSQLCSSYYILEIAGVRLHRYETLYFDTPGYSLYLKHHNKRLNRFKVRSRHYLASDLCYFEVKMKNNKGRTSKERNRHKGSQEVIAGKQAELLETNTKLIPEMLLPVLWVNFSRITLVNHEMSERVTIDTGLTFRNGSAEQAYPGVVIAEVKQERSQNSRFSEILHQAQIPKARISKYCLGVARLNPRVKQNNFKVKLLQLNLLNHDIC